MQRKDKKHRKDNETNDVTDFQSMETDSSTKTDTKTSTNPNLPTLKLEELVIASKYQQLNPDEQTQAILKDFNLGIKHTAFTHSVIRGDRIQPDDFMLGSRNNVSELAAFDPNYKIARTLNPSPNVRTELLGTHKKFMTPSTAQMAAMY